eukprot:gnl/TRDRNA2_/TRDRNA2_180342_c0_seq1.p1 gnl/TRDRNA2_/TRDRNA2_180342_c0~~gnl/TRDRNA2_/TRDRNA2_180342_c0_seq1.p1  ORF type:complete len:606 (+),score=83.78 gnl/TRDRNA2_/TRDRNA2_180342_c0_seq1:89-1906(+)
MSEVVRLQLLLQFGVSAQISVSKDGWLVSCSANSSTVHSCSSGGDQGCTIHTSATGEGEGGSGSRGDEHMQNGSRGEEASGDADSGGRTGGAKEDVERFEEGQEGQRRSEGQGEQGWQRRLGMSEPQLHYEHECGWSGTRVRDSHDMPSLSLGEANDFGPSLGRLNEIISDAYTGLSTGGPAPASESGTSRGTRIFQGAGAEAASESKCSGSFEQSAGTEGGNGFRSTAAAAANGSNNRAATVDDGRNSALGGAQLDSDGLEVEPKLRLLEGCCRGSTGSADHDTGPEESLSGPPSAGTPRVSSAEVGEPAGVAAVHQWTGASSGDDSPVLSEPMPVEVVRHHIGSDGENFEAEDTTVQLTVKRTFIDFKNVVSQRPTAVTTSCPVTPRGACRGWPSTDDGEDDDDGRGWQRAGHGVYTAGSWTEQEIKQIAADTAFKHKSNASTCASVESGRFAALQSSPGSQSTNSSTTVLSGDSLPPLPDHPGWTAPTTAAGDRPTEVTGCVLDKSQKRKARRERAKHKLAESTGIDSSIAEDKRKDLIGGLARCTPEDVRAKVSTLLRENLRIDTKEQEAMWQGDLGVVKDHGSQGREALRILLKEAQQSN